MNKTMVEEKNTEVKKTKCLKVVIIEDFKLTRVGLRCALNTNPDIDVVGECDNAVIGLDVINRIKPDVVLMDLGLPEMNGLEATVKVKESWPEIKVIALTSHEMEEEVLAAFASGVNAYCLKDIDPNKLADVIRDVSQGVCWIDPQVANMVLRAFPTPENMSLISSKAEITNRIPLTEREQEVLKHLVMGKSNTEIAKELIVSVHTAKAHVCSILQKMCVNDRVQAAVKAVKEGLV